MNDTKRNIETIMAFEGANLIVDYFWDNHGKEVKWNDHVNYSTVWNKASIKINKVSFTQQVLDMTFDFEAKQLIVDGTVIGGDVTKVEVDLDEDGILNVYCKVTVGWG